MIRNAGFIALALLGCTSVGAAADNRIRTLAYDPDQITRILGKAGIQSTIQFADDERIENVAVGDSSAWQITPNRRASLLFVKPLTAHSRTNMTVVTDRRTYMFDLVSGEKSSTPIYALKFSYPNEKRVGVAAKAVDPVVTAAKAAPAVLTADKLHFDWKSKGSDKLLPARVFDDGNSLFLAWNRDTPLPAILTLSEERKEGPVNYRMSGEYIVVTPIPQNVVLRYGKRSAVLWSTRRIVPAQPAPTNALAGKMAVGTVTETQQPVTPTTLAHAAPVAAPPPTAAKTTVKLANVTSLYSDKLTDSDHDH
jgi:type IV secretion system protein VirB9